jgi:K+-sensing histidine kinase KdpD
MAQNGQLLLVLEDDAMSETTTRYAIKLAKRMDCSLSVLILSAFKDETAFDLKRQQRLIDDVQGILEDESAKGLVAFRPGDKASQLLKHIALTPSVKAIVWRGDEDIVAGRRPKMSAHWFAKVRSHIACPIIIPERLKQADSLSTYRKGDI